jgi:hypothetical protein
MLGSSSVAAQLTASQDVLSSTRGEWVSELASYVLNLWPRYFNVEIYVILDDILFMYMICGDSFVLNVLRCYVQYEHYFT